jgi:hypothetical protein
VGIVLVSGLFWWSGLFLVQDYSGVSIFLVPQKNAATGKHAADS